MFDHCVDSSQRVNVFGAETKEELEQRMAEIKALANRVRGKLKGLFAANSLTPLTPTVAIWV